MHEWRGCAKGLTGGRHRALRSRWRTASLAGGWPFPSDWGSTAVDRVCAVLASRSRCAADEELITELGALGAARAEAGVGLGGTLRDLAALHAASADLGSSSANGGTGHGGLVAADPDAVPSGMLRATALGWAEVIARQHAQREVREPLTGLTTAVYLRTRLGEVYREAHAAGRAPGADRVLAVVTLEVPSEGEDYSRTLAMVLAADVLRSVFDTGESVSLLRPSTAVVLAYREEALTARCERVRKRVTHRILADPALAVASTVRIRLEQLPEDHDRACDLLTRLP